MQIRITSHMKRIGKDGKPFLAGHNDRKKGIKKSDHIDLEKSKENIYSSDLGFEKLEKAFYRDCLFDHQRKQNEKNISAGHPERNKTVKQIYENKDTCPEERLIYFGSKKNHLPKEKIEEIYKAHLKWQEENFPNVKILDWALHLDEKGAPHIHERRVYVAHDKDGCAYPSQSKALKEMGFDGQADRFDNPKMRYTKQIRQNLIDLTKELAPDVDIITVPQEASKSGLSLLDYQASEEKAEIERLRALGDEILDGAKKKAFEDLKMVRGSLKKVIMEAVENAQDLSAKNYLKATGQWDQFVYFLDQESEEILESATEKIDQIKISENLDNFER